MPKPLPLTDDLIALQRVAFDAELAVAEYCALVQGRRRVEFPDDVVARCTWAAEETAELDRLREAYIAAVLAVRADPIWEKARTASEPCHAQTWQALKDAVRELAAA